MKIYIPLKDILLGPGKRFDPSVNSEAEVIGFIKKAYGIISSTMEVSITDGVVCIAFKDATPARINEALQNFSKGVSQAQNGNLSDALKLFKSVLEVIPEHIDARRNLAKVYLELGNIEQAEKRRKEDEENCRDFDNGSNGSFYGSSCCSSYSSCAK